MILSFTGPRGGFSTGVEQVLLFRDNVQHHLQAGVPSGTYRAIHRIADVAGSQGGATVPARDLWNEVSAAFRSIRSVDRRELAMSIRTRAILTNVRDLPAVRGTALVRLTGWHVPLATFEALTLGDLFGSLVTRLEVLTNAGRCAWDVDVRADVIARVSSVETPREGWLK
jgi:hypothetical protein